jgi:hypothetical protein
MTQKVFIVQSGKLTSVEKSIDEAPMDFREMLTGLFNVTFISPEEFETLAKAGELYAKGCVKRALASTPPDKPSEGLREALKKIVGKYKKYLDNIVWHITTNQPKGTEAEICHKRVDDYTEILNDLHSLIKK